MIPPRLRHSIQTHYRLRWQEGWEWGLNGFTSSAPRPQFCSHHPLGRVCWEQSKGAVSVKYWKQWNFTLTRPQTKGKGPCLISLSVCRAIRTVRIYTHRYTHTHTHIRGRTVCCRHVFSAFSPFSGKVKSQMSVSCIFYFISSRRK